MTLGAASLGARLDVALTQALRERGVACSRAQLARAFRDRRVTIVGEEIGRALKPSRLVDRPLAILYVHVSPAPSRAEPEALPLAIVHEDEALIVVNKPAGVVVHAGPGHPRGALINAILHHLGASADDLPVLPGNDASRPGIVHRLDRDTSGLLVVAKRKPALEALAQQFRVHTIERVYLGVVCGAPRWPEVSLRTRHGRDPKERRRFSPDVDRGRWAITHAWRERVFVDAAVLRFELETGRTHQIRMHARHLGHPIVGDRLYGPRAGSPRVRALAKTLGRHALHAASLGFCHPSSGQTLRFRASLPPELQSLVTALARG